jgi:hypothetical protein
MANKAKRLGQLAVVEFGVWLVRFMIVSFLSRLFAWGLFGCELRVLVLNSSRSSAGIGGRIPGWAS